MNSDTGEGSNIDPKANLLAQEIKFAKLLAGNDTNPAKKKKQLDRLKIWLKNRTNCSHPFTDNDCLRVWKGLFYSMWMADKPLNQENLATDIASLVHCFDNVEVSLQFFAMFLKTMAAEWSGIDQWRIDKFMMLVRKITRETFVLLKNNEWNKSEIKEFSKKLHETVLAPDTPKGLFMHFTELYLEEVAKVTDGELLTETLTYLLKPFMKFVARSKEYKLIKCVRCHIFNHLLFQSEDGREYQEKYDVWKSMGFPGNSVDDIVLEEVENGDGEKSGDGDKDDGKEDNSDDSDADDNTNSELNGDEKILDPRAGRVNVDMPEIFFDALEIANVFESMKYKKKTRSKNRKSIDYVVNTYKTFATGKFPIGIQKLNIDRSKLQLPSIDQKADELLKFEHKLFDEQRRLKKLNKRKRKKLLSLSEIDETTRKSPKRIKIKHTATEWQEEDIDPDESVGPENSKKKITNGKPVINDEYDSTVTIQVNNKNISVQMKKKKQGNDKKNRKNKVNNKKSPAKSEWDESLKEGEIEYFLPSKKLRLEQANSSLNEEKIKVKIQSMNGDKLISKCKNSTPESVKSITITSLKKQKKLSMPTPSIAKQNGLPKPIIASSEKKVKIMLKMNTSQEPTEYINQLKQSPQLPYDSARRPVKGVLKPNLMPSPINPFYRKMIGL